jgi:N,N-dimethylformamidase beta subunit-like, C-terminal/IPT/TIG domain
MKCAGLFAAVIVCCVGSAAAQTPDNQIVVENQQPGSGGWFFSKLGDDVTGQIKGYASATSVNQNETITFHVSVNPAQAYTIDFYRLGWYAGNGGRLRSHVGPLSGVQQPECTPDAQTGLIACNWPIAYALTVPSDWTSGVYVALLTNTDGFQNYVPFVVKDNRRAPFLYQRSIVTDQAYNNYPDNGTTGKSLYGWNSYGANTMGGTPGAVKVSFDRPMAGSGLGILFNWELNFIRWMERSGYDVTYSTNIDTHANGAELRNHRAFLSAGHDEYWSKEMFDAAEAARDAGVNLGFFGANNVYTQVRFEPSASGTPNRVVVCYRSYPWFPIDPVQGPTTTTEFRQAPVNRPEQTLIGVQYTVTHPNFDYVVTNSSHWVYAGTGFRDGDIVPGIVGYEADALMPNFAPPNALSQTILSRSPYDDGGVTKYTNSSIYQAPSGAWVFAAGTMSWSWALDEVPGPYRHFVVDARIQQATANVMNAFLGSGPKIDSFTPTSGRAGTLVTITGSGFADGATVAFNGLPAAAVQRLSETSIQATAPAGVKTGPISVTTTGGTSTSATNFMVLPTLSGFSPASGPVGTAVTIAGSDLAETTGVDFNGVAATFTVSSDTTIQTTVPVGATTGALTVTTPAGATSSGTPFSVVPPVTIQSFQPDRGRAGTLVTITGSGFVSGATVAFNGLAAASVRRISDTSLEATAPTGVKTGPIAVTTPGGTAASPSSFLVLPTISGFSPASGPIGAAVTISGVDFTGTTRVTFNGTAATFTVPSDTTIQTVVPAGATTGPLAVTTPAGATTTSTSFSVAPTVNGLTPTSGRVGAIVTISGLNFTGTTGVRFNGAPASFSVTSATSIQATVPTGAMSGPITVTTPAGTGSSATSFIVRYTLTVTKTGLVGGTVTSDPVGINCGSSCTADYNSGTTVTLTANPAFLSIFNGWSGCDSVSGTTCTVIMNNTKRVTANFIP